MNGNGRLPARQTYTSRSCGRQRQGLRLASRPVTASSREKNAQISPAGAGEGSEAGCGAGHARHGRNWNLFGDNQQDFTKQVASESQSVAKPVHRVIRGA